MKDEGVTRKSQVYTNESPVKVTYGEKKVVRSKFIYISHLARFFFRALLLRFSQRGRKLLNDRREKPKIKFIFNRQCSLLNRA